VAEVEILPIPKPKLTANVFNETPIRIQTQTTHSFIDGEAVYGCGHSGNTCADGGPNYNHFVDADEFNLTTIGGSPIVGTNPPCGVYTSGGIYSVHREIQMNAAAASGPWEHNNALYYLIEDHAGLSQGSAADLNDQLSMMKRQPGGTWLALDNANAPSRNTGLPATERLLLLAHGAFKRGNTIWVAGVVDNPTASIDFQVFIQPFDLTSEMWGAKINGGTDIEGYSGVVAGGNRAQGIRCCVSADGTKILVFSAGIRETIASQGYDRPYVRIYDTGTGTWSAQIMAFGSADPRYFGPAGCVIDDSDVVHLFALVGRNDVTVFPNGSDWIDEGELLHRTISLAGTLGGVTTLALGVVGSINEIPVGQPIYYHNGTEGRLAIPYTKGSPGGTPGTADTAPVASIRLLTAASAVLSWTDEVVTADVAVLPPKGSLQVNAGIGSAAINPVYEPATGEVWLFWSTDQNLVTGDNPAEIYYARRAPVATWAAPVLWKSGNGLDPLWATSSTATIFEPGPLWFGNPQPVVFGGLVQVAYSRFFQNQVRDCQTSGTGIPQTRIFEFPHFDFVNLCPTIGEGNYSYFD
jgi:hypothetical protein